MESVEGVYAYRDPPSEHGCADEPEAPRPYALLRFFASRVVVSASVISDDIARDWPVISAWLSEEHQDRGTFQVTERTISFKVTSAAGAVDYFGTIGAGSLALSWRSAINGTIRNGLTYVKVG